MWEYGDGGLGLVVAVAVVAVAVCLSTGSRARRVDGDDGGFSSSSRLLLKVHLARIGSFDATGSLGRLGSACNCGGRLGHIQAGSWFMYVGKS